MKNFWAQREYCIASWHADMTACLGSPKVLLSLIHDVYVAACETRLILPVDVDLSAAVDRRWSSEHTVDLFRLIKGVQVESELAWYSRSDQVVEGRVADLGALLASLQPVPNAISRYNREVGHPPVALTGGQVSYAGQVAKRSSDYPETFTLSLYSDIWFPFVIGFAHPAADDTRFFDNRELANRHTTRLNRLLGRISRRVFEAGGRWYLDEDDLDPKYAPWLSADGIGIDGTIPELIPASLVDVEWPSDDGE
jgi:hypothetical protein